MRCERTTQLTSGGIEVDKVNSKSELSLGEIGRFVSIFILALLSMAVLVGFGVGPEVVVCSPFIFVPGYALLLKLGGD